MTWECPSCKRTFTRANQRHACGTGADDVTRDRPEHLVRLYAAFEAFVRGLGDVELVTRERYVLCRSTRIFADLTVMKDALRLAIHLGREVTHPAFIKTVSDRRHVTHVVKLTSDDELRAMQPYLTEAYTFSLH